MLQVVAIVGRPNVGKSQIFNRIVGRRQSIVDDFYGLTRDRIYGEAEWNNKTFKVIDTGGIEVENTTFQNEIQTQVEIALEEADVIIFVLDIRTPYTDDDLKIAKLLRKSNKPVVVALNKADNRDLMANMYDFYGLGFDELFAVSGIHSIGIGDMLDAVIAHFDESKKEENNEEDDSIKLAIIGRPNVGKSSLTNAILNKERVIVSSIEGTTTDSIDTSFIIK